MGKGSKQRPLLVSREEFATNWDQTFFKPLTDVEVAIARGLDVARELMFSKLLNNDVNQKDEELEPTRKAVQERMDADRRQK